jgi:PTH2 family peptidyl-tRNA hydrolase
MDDRPTKQVIVVRKFQNLRTGKYIAQGSHSTVGVILRIQETINAEPDHPWAAAYKQWLATGFRKICLYVNTPEELNVIYNQALTASLPVKLITDSGLTEFHGVPTVTCLAIGPYWDDEINAVTGSLPLF